MAEAVLYAEIRMGELIKTIPSHVGRIGGGVEKSLPDGISHKQSHYARQLADNQDIVCRGERERIPVNSL